MYSNSVTRFKKIWFHVLIWLFIILFFLWGPRIIDMFFIKDGKPSRLNIDIPEESDQIKYSLDLFESFDKQGYVYEMRGWAFTTDDPNNPTNTYLTEIVLSSGNKNMIFSTQSKGRADVIKAFEDLNLNIREPGFSTLISKSLLKPGVYSIGILLKQTEKGFVRYIETNMVINRTPNTIQLSKKSKP